MTEEDFAGIQSRNRSTRPTNRAVVIDLHPVQQCSYVTDSKNYEEFIAVMKQFFVSCPSHFSRADLNGE